MKNDKMKKIRCPYCKQWCISKYSLIVLDLVKRLLKNFK